MPLTALDSRTFRASINGDAATQRARIAPSDVEVLALDFSDCLGSDSFNGTPSWTSSSTSAVTVVSEDSSGAEAQVLISGVAVGESVLTCRAVLAPSGREYRRSITVHVRSPL